MKYVSIDIETTGLDPYQCHILEIGAIIEDTNNPQCRNLSPTFHCFIDREQYGGSLFALDMNANLLHRILKAKQNKGWRNIVLLKENVVAHRFKRFLYNHGIAKPIFAGKNISRFDLRFLCKLPDWGDIQAHHRTLDPTFAYIDWHEDEVPPDTAECKRRAGLGETVSHRALDDAWDIIQLIRVKEKQYARANN